MTNRRLIIKIQRRGGIDHDAAILAHAATVVGRLMSARMANTVRITIKLRAGLSKDRLGDCAFRDMSKGSTARSKHYTIRLQRDQPLHRQLSTLTHELKHAEQMATGRLACRVTYGQLGYFWRPVGHTGPAIKYDLTCNPGRDVTVMRNGQEILWHQRPWEKEAIDIQNKLAALAGYSPEMGRTDAR